MLDLIRVLWDVIYNHLSPVQRRRMRRVLTAYDLYEAQAARLWLHERFYELGLIRAEIFQIRRRRTPILLTNRVPNGSRA